MQYTGMISFVIFYRTDVGIILESTISYCLCPLLSPSSLHAAFFDSRTARPPCLPASCGPLSSVSPLRSSTIYLLPPLPSLLSPFSDACFNYSTITSKATIRGSFLSLPVPFCCPEVDEVSGIQTELDFHHVFVVHGRRLDTANFITSEYYLSVILNILN